MVDDEKDAESKHAQKDLSYPQTKRHRVIWSVDLHQKFVEAVDQIGISKVCPEEILDLMNVEWLTREDVASHLQKYCLYLSYLPTKKGRVVWSLDLHQKFVKAIDYLIGFDGVGPEEILYLMNEERLTIEDVVSHLRKYCLYLRWLQRLYDLKISLAETKHSDSPSRDSSAIPKLPQDI